MRVSRLRMGNVRSAVVVGAAVLLSSPVDLVQANHRTSEGTDMHLSLEWDKTFPKSEKVAHKKVTFKNRYGITLAGICTCRRTARMSGWQLSPSWVRLAR